MRSSLSQFAPLMVVGVLTLGMNTMGRSQPRLQTDLRHGIDSLHLKGMPHQMLDEVVKRDGQQRHPSTLRKDVSPQSQYYVIDTAVVLGTPANASPDATVYYFYEPFPMEPGEDVFQVGASFSLVPYADAEQEIPLPGVDVQYKRGIFDNVALVGSLSSSYFSNLLHAGLQWNAKAHRFSFGAANHIGFAYGFIKRESLFDDVEAYAWIDMMILRLGYRFDEFSVSCSFFVTYMIKSMSYVNDIEASVGPKNTINDYYCTLVVEQPFLRTLHLSIGMSLGYTRTPWQTWMLYDTVDEWLFSPEFFFAFQIPL